MQKLLLLLSKVCGKSLEDYKVILGKLHLFPDDKYCKSVHLSFQVDFIAYLCKLNGLYYSVFIGIIYLFIFKHEESFTVIYTCAFNLAFNQLDSFCLKNNVKLINTEPSVNEEHLVSCIMIIRWASSVLENGPFYTCVRVL